MNILTKNLGIKATGCNDPTFLPKNELVLLSLLDKNKELYGSQIHIKVIEVGNPMTLATIYATLKRMEQEKLVVSRFTNQSNVKRGLNRRRFYEITGKGHKIFDIQQAKWMNLWNTLPT